MIVRFDYVEFEPSDSDWLLYRYPRNDIFKDSKLVVAHNQRVIIEKSGKIENILGPGEHDLSDAKTIPFVTWFAKRKFRDASGRKIKDKHDTICPYNIYFFNSALAMNLKWAGLPIRMTEKLDGEPMVFTAIPRGSMTLEIENFQYFLDKVVGTITKDGYCKFQFLKNMLEPLVRSKVSILTKKSMKERGYGAIDMQEAMGDIQLDVLEGISDFASKYGLLVHDFIIEDFNLSEKDQEKLEEISRETVKAHNERKHLRSVGRGKAEGLSAYRGMGANEFTQYNVMGREETLKEGAKNSKSGAGTFMGIGMGLNLGKQFNNGDEIGGSAAAQGAAAEKAQLIKCPSCGEMIKAKTKFCPECGAPIITKCPKCKTQVPPGMKFCPECGEKLYKK